MLKTYDPASGACLKYKTDKAAEVGRLVGALGKCGRVMAELPPKVEASEEEKIETEASSKVADDAKAAAGGKVAKGGQGQTLAKGGVNKKKKGKR